LRHPVASSEIFKLSLSGPKPDSFIVFAISNAIFSISKLIRNVNREIGIKRYYF